MPSIRGNGSHSCELGSLPQAPGESPRCTLLSPQEAVLFPAGPRLLGTHKSDRWPGSCLLNPKTTTQREKRILHRHPGPPV